MQIEFRFKGESRTKSSVTEGITMEGLLTTCQSLFDDQTDDHRLQQDCEMRLVNSDGTFVKVMDPSKELYNGAIIDILCLNNEGQNNKDENSQNTDSKEDLIIKDMGKLNIIAAQTDHKQESPPPKNGNDMTDIDTNIEEVKSERFDNSTKQKTTESHGNTDNGNNRYVARLRGLPWSARESEITAFFSEENVTEVQIVFLTDGRASGEALVEFSDIASFQTAFLKNRHHIGHRYIEIFKSTGIEIDTAAGRAVRPPARPPKSQYVIRMRGLPYSATDEDVLDFFDMPKPTGIHLIKDDLGRPSGEGFVEFKTEVDAIAAMAKHRHHMGHRYIELFRSSPEELMRALGLTTGWYNSRNGPQPKSSCILMRGLPYSCTESDITKFFQEIDVTPIRIHRKADGAEAYVEFYSISDTDKAMTRHRNYIGRRYIELFRVTYEDMARTVGLPVANTNIPASALTITSSAYHNQLLQPHFPSHIQLQTASMPQHSYPMPTQAHAPPPPQMPHSYTNTPHYNSNQNNLLLSANINALMTHNPLVIGQSNGGYQQSPQQTNSHIIINGTNPHSNHHYQQRQPSQQYYQPQYY